MLTKPRPKLSSLLCSYHFPITLFVGSLLVSAWTIYRFWTEKSIFDLIGQQLLARIFISDGHMDATVGATHYIAKIFLIYIPVDLLHLEPRASLIGMTLLLNITSFILIAYAIKSIARHFNIYRPTTFSVALLWLASMAGSIFWIEFANSRNIEVAAGLWSIALGLNFATKPSYKNGVTWSIVTATAFFMDPLQIYMMGGPLLIYILILCFIQKNRKTSGLKTGVLSFAIVAVSVLVSVIILALCENLTGVHVISSQSSALGGIVNHASEALKGLAAANIRMFGGYVTDGGRIRQCVALIGLIGVLVAWAIYALKRKIPLSFVIFVTVFIGCIELIYLLSGQSSNGDTSRYLIMAAPVLALVIISLPKSKISTLVHLILSTVIVLNVAALAYGLAKSSSTAFSQDTFLGLAAQLTEQQPDTLFYASMDTSLPAMFYYRDTKILPLSCQNDTLAQAGTFFPKYVFKKWESSQVSKIAILLDSNGSISNYPYNCTRSSIEKQLGAPREVLTTESTTVLYYNQTDLSFSKKP